MSHWYSSTGKTYHGHGDNFAKEKSLFPSVTAIIGQLNTEPLNEWRIKQALLLGDSCPRRSMEKKSVFCNRILKMAGKELGVASSNGTEFHKLIETRLLGSVPSPDLNNLLCDLSGMAYHSFRESGYREVQVEKVLVGNKWGGTMDCAFQTVEGFHGVMDWKVKRSFDGRVPFQSEKNMIQLAVYGNEYWKSEGCDILVNGFISLKESQVYFREVPFEHKWIEIFQNLVNMWWLRNRS